MHSSRMHTACSSPYGGLSYRDLWTETPQPETSLDRTPLWTETLQKEHGTIDRDLPQGAWDQAARQDMTSYRDRMTDMCKNITLPKLCLRTVKIKTTSQMFDLITY